METKPVLVATERRSVKGATVAMVVHIATRQAEAGGYFTVCATERPIYAATPAHPFATVTCKRCRKEAK